MDSFNKFLNMGTGLNAALKQIVKETAFELEEEISVNAPVDTGFLASSIYTVTKNSSSYGKSRSVAPKGMKSVRGKRRKVDTYTLDMHAEIDPPEDDFTAFVAVGAYYGVFVEFGTRYTTAQPFFFPAVDAAQESFDEKAWLIEDKLLGVI